MDAVHGANVVINMLYQFADNLAFLLLASLGLIVILGMMNIINFAHGEFMMLGAYIATIAYHAGIPLPLAMALSFIGVGLFGAVLDRLIIRRFYGRELAAMVVTWGISLLMSQGALVILGPYMAAIPTPQGSFSIGSYSYADYQIFLIVMSLALLGALAWGYQKTRIGTYARATMQNAVMARSLGVNTGHMYMLTFAVGSGLAGLSGALLAPTTTVAPLMGEQFVGPSFITVVVGGAASVITGALGSSTLLSVVQSIVGNALGSYAGTVALLFAALIIIRILPRGVSGWLLELQRNGRRSQARG